MNITLRPETEKRVNEKIRCGNFDSTDVIVEEALTFYLDYEQDEMDDREFGEVKASVEEGLQQASRGEGVSLEQFDLKMRAKYGIQR